MKTLKIILLISLFAAPAALLAQATEKRDSTSSKSVYQKRTYRKTMRLTEKDSIKRKENTPILKNNRTPGTTGAVDGKGAAGRAEVDTTVGYTVKRRKVTTVVIDGNQPESEQPKKKKP